MTEDKKTAKKRNKAFSLFIDFSIFISSCLIDKICCPYVFIFKFKQVHFRILSCEKRKFL